MSKPKFDEEAFARLLEGAEAPQSLDERRMGALVKALERARPEAAARPSSDFASALRSRIVAEAQVVAEAERAARLPLTERVVIAVRQRTEAWRRSFRVVTATGLAAMLLLGTGAAFASARHANPGDWNYGLKRAQEGARLAVTRGPLARGYLELQLARTRLDEVRHLAVGHVTEDALYIDTLNDMDASTLTATELLVKASRAGAGVAPLNKLQHFAIAQRLRLESLIDRLPEGARPAARDSIVVLVRLNDRVLSIVAGCACPANPLELPVASTATGGQSVGCSCSSGSHPGGTSGSGSDGSSNSGSGATGGSGDSGSGGGGKGDDGKGTVGDTVNGTVSGINGATSGAADDVNKILGGLGLPSVVPTPTIPPLPVPTPSLGL